MIFRLPLRRLHQPVHFDMLREGFLPREKQAAGTCAPETSQGAQTMGSRPYFEEEVR